MVWCLNDLSEIVFDILLSHLPNSTENIRSFGKKKKKKRIQVGDLSDVIDHYALLPSPIALDILLVLLA